MASSSDERTETSPGAPPGSDSVSAATATQHTHIPALDGIRGLAIVLVLFFHFALVGGDSPAVRLIQKTWGFGWVGVDLFFVLSGFLITGILYDAKAKSAGHFFRNFYARRTVRIFPIYFAFLAVFLILVPAMSTSQKLFGIPPVGAWAYWLYVYNLFQGHHDPATFSHTLGVTWSLCIEEQFYLIWPTVVFFCSSRTLLRICAGLMAASLLSRLILVSLDFPTYATSQWTFCRMEGLATGAALALLYRIGNLQPLIRPAWCLLIAVPAATIGLNFIGGSLNSNPVYRVVGYTSLAALFGSLLLLTITSAQSSVLVRVFSNPLMRMFGRYSYAIYLVNQPVKYVLLAFVFDPDKQLEFYGSKIPAQMLFFVFATAITVAIALASWNLFEKHFLKLKVLFPMDEKSEVRPAEQVASVEREDPSTGGRAFVQPNLRSVSANNRN